MERIRISVLIGLAFMVLSLSVAYTQPQQYHDIRSAALRLQRLLKERIAEGVDVSEAIILDRRSREAIRRGDRLECLRLLNKDIFIFSQVSYKH